MSESTNAVLLLLTEVKRLEEEKKHNEEELMKKIREMNENYLDEIINLRKAAQKICTHPEERSEDDFDYHRREDWTKYYCKICDKLLRRV